MFSLACIYTSWYYKTSNSNFAAKSSLYLNSALVVSSKGSPVGGVQVYSSPPLTSLQHIKYRFWTHCTENPIYVFPEMKLRGLVPNSYIHVSVSELYIPRIGLPILGCSKIGRLVPGMHKPLTDT
jgi:hypothetical protein